MAAARRGSAPPAFEFKSATLPLVAVMLRNPDLDTLERDLRARLGDTPDFFNQDPVVIDLGAVAEADTAIDFERLLSLLRGHRMQPIAVRAGGPAQMEAALAAGLSEAPAAAQGAQRTSPAPAADAPASAEAVPDEAPVAAAAAGGEAQALADADAAAQASAASPAASEATAQPAGEVPATPAVPATLVIDRPLRSGQQVYARGSDLVVLAAVNFGAEVIADGNIHVYAPLRGRAIAGARGNADARIITLCLEPELISIAGTYRTTENPIPPDVLGKPAQVRLVDDKLVMEPLKT